MTRSTSSPMPSASSAAVRLLGAPNSPRAFEIRDFLSRSVVAYDWVELDEASARSLPGISGLDDPALPVCEFPDGTRLLSASVPEIAQRLGWVSRPRLARYDVSIYGAGPAGLSAAVYAASEGLKTVLVERQAIGGQAGSSSLIENYLGFPHGISGVDLADGSQLSARTNICATGIEWRRLGLPGEERLLGAGLFYGAGSSEAPMCAGETVYVVGGGNSAGQAAMNLSHYAREVVLLVRGERLADTLSDYLLRKIIDSPGIRIVTCCEVIALAGDRCLEGISVRDRSTGQVNALPTRRMFVCIGGSPNTDWAHDTAIVRDAAGYLVTGPDLLLTPDHYRNWNLHRPPFHLETSVPGSFAVGDVRHGSVKRVASAVGEGAMAVAFVHQHLSTS